MKQGHNTAGNNKLVLSMVKPDSTPTKQNIGVWYNAVPQPEQNKNNTIDIIEAVDSTDIIDNVESDYMLSQVIIGLIDLHWFGYWDADIKWVKHDTLRLEHGQWGDRQNRETVASWLPIQFLISSVLMVLL